MELSTEIRRAASRIDIISPNCEDVNPINLVPPEFLIFFNMLQDKDYMITTRALTDMGIKRSTAQHMLNNMVKKGYLESVGKRSRMKLYRCKITREELEDLAINSKEYGY